MQSTHEAHAAEVADATATLNADASWARLNGDQRSAILAANGLLPPSKPIVGTDDELIAALDATSLEARGHLATVAKAGVAKALGEAVKLLTPKARQLPIKPATLSTESEVEAWVSARKTELLEAIKQGPVILG